MVSPLGYHRQLMAVQRRRPSPIAAIQAAAIRRIAVVALPMTAMDRVADARRFGAGRRLSTLTRHLRFDHVLW